MTIRSEVIDRVMDNAENVDCNNKLATYLTYKYGKVVSLQSIIQYKQSKALDINSMITNELFELLKSK